MKKTLLIVTTVLLLIVATFYADRATRVKVTTGNPTMKDAPGGDAFRRLEPEPELTLKDLNGNDVSLSDFKGKVLLVNFWATWCDACRAEVPWLVELQHKYGAKGLVILGIALDDEGAKVVAPFVARERFDVDGRKEPMDYRILIGSDDAAEKFGGLFGYPTSILISRDGKQVKRATGVIDPDEMTKTIEAQL